jgi:hypothetical protein
MLLPSHLPISSYSGSPRECGQALGEEHREGIRIGIEARPWKPRQWKYVEACMKTPWRFQREIGGFTQGMAKASGKNYLEISQNYCHEELGRMKHCTAVGATGPGTRSGQPIIGMNWDDSVMHHYAWARLIRLKMDGWPGMLLYSPYPGIWSGAGINEHGVSTGLDQCGSQCTPTLQVAGRWRSNLCADRRYPGLPQLGGSARASE